MSYKKNALFFYTIWKLSSIFKRNTICMIPNYRIQYNENILFNTSYSFCHLSSLLNSKSNNKKFEYSNKTKLFVQKYKKYQFLENKLFLCRQQINIKYTPLSKEKRSFSINRDKAKTNKVNRKMRNLTKNNQEALMKKRLYFSSYLRKIYSPSF